MMANPCKKGWALGTIGFTMAWERKKMNMLMININRGLTEDKSANMHMPTPKHERIPKYAYPLFSIYPLGHQAIFSNVNCKKMRIIPRIKICFGSFFQATIMPAKKRKVGAQR